MSSALLLNPNDPLFVFEHAMLTRDMWQQINTDGLSVVPYLLDPAYSTYIPASNWHQDHQQSHDDFNSVMSLGIPQGQILIDSSLGNRDSLTWWIFANHHEHYIANNVVFPSPSTAQSRRSTRRA